MRRLVAVCAFVLLGCSEPEPRWSDDPGIELCRDVVFECEAFQAYTDDFYSCVREVIQNSGIDERNDTHECYVPSDRTSRIEATASAASSDDDPDLCISDLHGRDCWRYP